jgi:acetyl-CoA C-acetyltransferase
MSRSVIVAGTRTAIGKLSGAFASLSAQDLGGAAIKGVLDRTGVDPVQRRPRVDGPGPPGRSGADHRPPGRRQGRHPDDRPATTVNKVCLSGLNAIYLADLMIRAGEADVVVAGGMESMTKAPYLLPGARSGYRLGDQKVVDSMMFDGLTCAFDQCAMGLSTERYNQGRISRERQDEFSARSHELGRGAIAAGKFAEEIVPVRCPSARVIRSWSTRRGRPARDDRRVPRPCCRRLREGRHDHRRQRLPDLRRRRGGHRDVGRRRTTRPHAPGRTRQLRPGRRARRLAAHPAFARHPSGGQGGPRRQGHRPLRDQRGVRGRRPRLADDLGIDEAKVNVNGGAIALGHPVGMSGTRLALSALTELRRRGGGVAAVALCGGGGQGDAALLRSL